MLVTQFWLLKDLQSVHLSAPSKQLKRAEVEAISSLRHIPPNPVINNLLIHLRAIYLGRRDTFSRRRCLSSDQ